MAVDSAGNAYLAGNTDTHDLPATAGAFLQLGVGAFVAKVKADGSGLSYLTYLSYTEYPLLPVTNPANTAVAVACDAAGNAYLTGTTFDPKFPATAGAFQPALNGVVLAAGLNFPPPDVFVLKFNPTGSAVVWGTYLGGSGAEKPNSIAVDSSQEVWLTGTTASPDFPNGQGWSVGSDFIAGLNSTGSKLVYSARYPNDGASRAVSVDSSGVLHVAGPSGIVSAIMPLSAPLPRIFGVANAANGPLDGRVAGGEVISIYGPHVGPAVPVVTGPDRAGNLPNSVGGYQVVSSLPNARPLALLYVSDSQINAVAPLGSYAAGPIHIVSPSGTTPDFPLTTVPALPEIFRNVDGSAIAINQDGTRNGQNNPAVVGSYASIWMTGSGFPVSGYEGHISTAANIYYCCGVEFDFGMASVVYAGNAPSAVLGVSQINFVVPATAPLDNPSNIRVIGRDGSVSRYVSFWVRF
ncbi:MAG: SBBP repeat-containing protein [Acidobacteriota bacterium]|nr:SBBP repeat-containing protein [Acidobacteriota bacterium]